MQADATQRSANEYTVLDPAEHDLHTCRDVEEFNRSFQAHCGCPIAEIADEIVREGSPRAIFLTGSLPLGMATRGSDIDLFVLVDALDCIRDGSELRANSSQLLEFSSGDALLGGMFVTLKNGILIDLQVIVTPAIRAVYERLRRRGPELSDIEIRTLGRLGTGWLLWQSERYLESRAVTRNNRAFDIYCCTKNFVSALIQCRKAFRALQQDDLPLALQLGRSSVEAAYLAYFASEELPFLGSKWLSQLSTAHGATERVECYPVLRDGVPLLFPPWPSDSARA